MQHDSEAELSLRPTWEMQVMKYLHGHPCVMPLLAALECREYYFLVMPVVGHDLFVAVEHRGAPDSVLAPDDLMVHTKQLFEGSCLAACGAVVRVGHLCVSLCVGG